MGIIYRWVNLINGKGYTGKTERSIEERERDRWGGDRPPNEFGGNLCKSYAEAFVEFRSG